MSRPRKAKQKPMQSHEIVGILPSEQADIQRALMASITKTTVSLSPPKKVGRPPKLSNTPLQSQSNSCITPKSVSSSPMSSSSIISFLSTDSLSSVAWTPPNRRSPRLSKQKKLSHKTSSPKKSFSKSKVAANPQKSSPKTEENPTKSVMKSAQVKKTLLKKKAKLIACAVRKNAVVEEARNETGLTVDEILRSVAAQNKLLDQPLSMKLSNPKMKKRLIPLTSPLQQNKTTPSPSRRSPKTTPKSSPRKEIASPKNIVKISKESNVHSPSPQATNSTSSVFKDGTNSATSPDRHSPNSFLYQAQRKFASNQSPPARPISQELVLPLRLQETPKTEDFLRFLCLRGSKTIPGCLKKFDLPWTPTISVSSGHKSSCHEQSTVIGSRLNAQKNWFQARDLIN